MISIITICFNDLEGLKKTQASIASQACSDFEWIVIDGASTDGTPQYLSKLSTSVRFISERDAGIYDAMHKGLRLATRDFILFLNSGDCLDSPIVLGEFYNNIASAIDVFFFDTRICTNKRSWIRPAKPFSYARYGVPAIQQSTVYSRTKLLTLSWPSNFRICGDYALVAQMYSANMKAVVVHTVLSRFALGGVSTTALIALSTEAAKIQKSILKLGAPYIAICFARRLATGCVNWLIHSVTPSSIARALRG